MTMGDFNTSEKASLPNFWVWGFNWSKSEFVTLKITLKIQRQLSFWLFYCYLYEMWLGKYIKRFIIDTIISYNNKLISLCNKVIFQLSYSKAFVAMVTNRSWLLLKHDLHKTKNKYPALIWINMHISLNAWFRLLAVFKMPKRHVFQVLFTPPTFPYK